MKIRKMKKIGNLQKAIDILGEIMLYPNPKDNPKYSCKEVRGMETKSRYEVIAELEEKKRELILEGDNIDSKLKFKERELKELKRRIEDKEEEIKEFKDKMKQMKDTNKELIKSIDDSLKRFENMKQREETKK